MAVEELGLGQTTGIWPRSPYGAGAVGTAGGGASADDAGQSGFDPLLEEAAGRSMAELFPQGSPLPPPGSRLTAPVMIGLDANKDGTLQSDEIPLSEDAVAALDADGDGLVSINELSDALTGRTPEGLALAENYAGAAGATSLADGGDETEVLSTSEVTLLADPVGGAHGAAPSGDPLEMAAKALIGGHPLEASDTALLNDSTGQGVSPTNGGIWSPGVDPLGSEALAAAMEDPVGSSSLAEAVGDPVGASGFGGYGRMRLAAAAYRERMTDLAPPPYAPPSSGGQGNGSPAGAFEGVPADQAPLSPSYAPGSWRAQA